MPIYAYRCEACGFAKDVLQKMSDDALTVCPSCGKDTYKKQLTAAGFQLKGTGWYVTDFRGGANGAAAAPAVPAATDAAAAATPATATPAAPATTSAAASPTTTAAAPATPATPSAS